jgi:hypothetical protein
MSNARSKGIGERKKKENERYSSFLLMGETVVHFFTIENGEHVIQCGNKLAQYADYLSKEVNEGKLDPEDRDFLCQMEFQRLFFGKETKRNEKIPENAADANEEYETAGFAMDDCRPNSNQVLNFMIVRRKRECDGSGEGHKK